MDLTKWAWLIVPLGMTRAMQIVLWDRITERPRGWLMAKLNPAGLGMKDPGRGYLSYLLECPWCMSVWLGIGAAILLVNEATRSLFLWLLAALALSLLMVLIDRVIDRTLPDEPAPPTPVVHGDVIVGAPGSGEFVPFVEDIPADVAAAFDALTGDTAPEET